MTIENRPSQTGESLIIGAKVSFDQNEYERLLAMVAKEAAEGVHVERMVKAARFLQTIVPERSPAGVSASYILEKVSHEVPGEGIFLGGDRGGEFTAPIETDYPGIDDGYCWLMGVKTDGSAAILGGGGQNNPLAVETDDYWPIESFAYVFNTVSASQEVGIAIVPGDNAWGASMEILRHKGLSEPRTNR